MAIDGVDRYLDEHRSAFEESLKALIRIPSVSAQPDHDGDTRKAAEFVRDDLRAMGVPADLVEFAKGHPIVYGERLDAPGKPTLLVYGHYDVQPAEPIGAVAQPPVRADGPRWQPVRPRGDRRQGADVTHLKAAEAWLKTAGRLPVNVKFLIEGEEEVGGANLEAFIAGNKGEARVRLRRDLRHQPVRPGPAGHHVWAEGAGVLRVVVNGAKSDLHSGTFGGAVANPLNALAVILASLKGPDGRIQIEGFYDKVRPLEQWERDEFAKLPFSEAEFRNSLGVTSVEGEFGYTTLERKWARPTCDVNGIYRRLSRPRPEDRPALQGRREVQLPPRARPGRQDDRPRC